LGQVSTGHFLQQFRGWLQLRRRKFRTFWWAAACNPSTIPAMSFCTPREAIKVLFHDGSGLCLFYKRLDRRTFRLPEPRPGETATIEVDEATLDDLLDGIDVEKRPSRVQIPLRSQMH
jgi:transposase